MSTTRKGFTVWLTGLPCAGKTTLAMLLADELKSRGYRVEVLDGDAVRRDLSKGLGFSKEDRDENVRRIGSVCRTVTAHGTVAVVAVVSPYRSLRDEVRETIGKFFEVYVKASIHVCIQRDVRGLYKRALAGEIKGFTGVDDPYEPPLNPELTIETETDTPQDSLARIVRSLEALGYLRPHQSSGSNRGIDCSAEMGRNR